MCIKVKITLSDGTSASPFLKYNFELILGSYRIISSLFITQVISRGVDVLYSIKISPTGYVSAVIKKLLTNIEIKFLCNLHPFPGNPEHKYDP